MVFASIRPHASTAIFHASRSRDKKKLLCEQGATQRVQLASSEHVLYFPLAAIHMEILFFKIKQKIFLKDDVTLIAKFKEITGPFILGKLAQNLKRSSPNCTQAIPKIF